MVQVLNMGGTVTFKCPVCKQIHSKAQFGGDEYICTNSIKKVRKTQNARPVDIISRRAYNLNKLSTKEDRYDDIELTNVNKSVMSNNHRDFGGGKKGDNW